MPPPQITSLRADIERVLSAPAGEELCVTWQHAAHGEHWAQVTRYELNVAYREQVEPRALLVLAANCGVALELLDWQAADFATFSFSAEPAPEALASLVLRVLAHTAAVSVESLALSASFERLE